MRIILLEIDEILNNYYIALNSYLIDNRGLYFMYNRNPSSSYFYPMIFKDFVTCKGLIDLSPKHYTIDLINKLKNQGFTIYLVTERDDSIPGVVQQTYSWLREHKVEYTELFFAPKKELWYGNQNIFRLDDVVFALEYNPRWIEYLCSSEIKVVSPNTKYLPNISSDLLKPYYDTPPITSLESVIRSILEKI